MLTNKVHRNFLLAQRLAPKFNSIWCMKGVGDNPGDADFPPGGVCETKGALRASVSSAHRIRRYSPHDGSRGGGGGGILIIFLGGGVPPSPENPYPISDPTLKTYTLFQTLWGVVISANVFFFAINVHGNTRYFKNVIPDQTDGVYTLFQTKMAKSTHYFRLEMLENDTLWGGQYIYGLYMGVHPPPPPPGF